ncbi:transcriptional regulator [Lacrimispora amygdalina]|uniref:Transcriptional regulator n=1 Tax=Lacrimispora amygdalina TaxID=253257 RepID=A0ABQ5M4J4_9FIRM
MIDISKLIEDKNLSESEEAVLHYMIDHIDEVMKMGVRGVAKNTFTSTSTIMRLTKKLGYSGFVDMHYKLLPLVKNVEISSIVNEEFINYFHSNSIFQYNSYTQLRDFAKLLYDMKSSFIFIYATGFSAIAAEYLYKKFLVLGKKCILASGMDSVGVFENNLDEIGLMVVISKSGETKLVLDKVKTAKENQIKTISFTSENTNSVNELADICFRINDNNKLDDRNMMPNTFFPQLFMLIETIVYEYHKVVLVSEGPKKKEPDLSDSFEANV